MILLDDRGGSKGVAGYPTLLQSLIPNSELVRLDSGDVAFTGSGDISIGIELKKVTDALSCMFSSRLADMQLPAMADAYDVRYLVIEEPYRADPASGVLQRWRAFPSKADTICGKWYDAHCGRNRVTYQAFEMWLHTLSEYGGARLERTPNIEGTATLIQALYCWWQREDHRSMNVMHTYQGDSASLARPTVLRRIAAQLPSIGWERSKAVVERFHSVEEMVIATEEEWCEIDGIGKGIARKVMGVLHSDVK